jgi:hypothetical protein
LHQNHGNKQIRTARWIRLAAIAGITGLKREKREREREKWDACLEEYLPACGGGAVRRGAATPAAMAPCLVPLLSLLLFAARRPCALLLFSLHPIPSCGTSKKRRKGPVQLIDRPTMIGLFFGPRSGHTFVFFFYNFRKNNRAQQKIAKINLNGCKKFKYEDDFKLS